MEIDDSIRSVITALLPPEPPACAKGGGDGSPGTVLMAFLSIDPTNAKVSRSRGCGILGHADELSWFREGAVACA